MIAFSFLGLATSAVERPALPCRLRRRVADGQQWVRFRGGKWRGSLGIGAIMGSIAAFCFWVLFDWVAWETGLAGLASSENGPAEAVASMRPPKTGFASQFSDCGDPVLIPGGGKDGGHECFVWSRG